MKRPLSLYAKGVALTAHGLLMAALIVWGGNLSLIAAVLLAVPLPGLLRDRLYTYQWASMLLVFYAALWLAEGYANPAGRAVAFAIASLAAFDFVSLVLCVRWRQREQLARAAASGGVSE